MAKTRSNTLDFYTSLLTTQTTVSQKEEKESYGQQGASAL